MNQKRITPDRAHRSAFSTHSFKHIHHQKQNTPLIALPC